MKFVTRQQGMSLIETMIGLAIIFTTLVSLISVYNFFIKTSQKNNQAVQAGFLVEGGLEILRFIRDGGWEDFSAIPKNENKFFVRNSGGWVAGNQNNFIDGIFERKFILNSVYRDNEDNISETGILDDGTIKATVFVSWFGSGATTTIQKNVYFNDLFEN